jgi:hypothetical protein
MKVNGHIHFLFQFKMNIKFITKLFDFSINSLIKTPILLTNDSISPIAHSSRH